jgi:hypothetical protein
MNDFNFYENVIAFSMQNPVKGKDITIDFLLQGDGELLVKGLIEAMKRHEPLKAIIIIAALEFEDVL